MEKHNLFQVQENDLFKKKSCNYTLLSLAKILFFILNNPLFLFLLGSPVFFFVSKFKNSYFDTRHPIFPPAIYAEHVERPNHKIKFIIPKESMKESVTAFKAAYPDLASGVTFTEEITNKKLNTLDKKDLVLRNQKNSSPPIVKSIGKKIKGIKPSGILALGPSLVGSDSFVLREPGLELSLVQELKEFLAALKEVPATLDRGNLFVSFYQEFGHSFLRYIFETNSERMLDFGFINLQYLDFEKVPEHQQNALSGVVFTAQQADGTLRQIRANRSRFQQIFQELAPEYQRIIDLFQTSRAQFQSQPMTEQKIIQLQEQIPILSQNLANLKSNPQNSVRDFSVESSPAIVQYYSNSFSGVQMAASLDLQKYDLSFGLAKSVFHSLGQKKFGIVSGVDVGLRFKRTTNSYNYGGIGVKGFVGVGYRF